jgi:UDP-N-acetylglucosamine--N-acetylmuramyl-(pentapeptide) pyrophosphoryl-undecaprenol N-acetylglucosamine transferase
VPAGLAASLGGTPLVFLNADAAPQLSLRLLKSLLSAVFCGFDGGAAQIAGERAVVSGNPVRDVITKLPPPAERYAARSGPLSLLVIGGSLGAQTLNENVPAALALIDAPLRPRVVHQCGAAHADATRAAYAKAGVAAEVLTFIDDIAARYGEADLVLCRSGAITVTELTAAGVPAVLVPLVVSTTDHQRSNAEYLASHGAAIHLPQTELTPPRLADIVRAVSRAQLLEMANRARALGKPNATRVVADAIEHIAGSQR